MKLFIFALLAPLLGSTLVSCSSVKSTMSKTMSKITAPVKSLAKLNRHDLRRLKIGDLRTNTPPIVEVRKGDLKKGKTAEERILAYNRAKRQARIQRTSVASLDFDFSDLPEPGDLPTIGILPSLTSEDGQLVTTGVDLDSTLPDLPATPGTVPPIPEPKKAEKTPEKEESEE